MPTSPRLFALLFALLGPAALCRAELFDAPGMVDSNLSATKPDGKPCKVAAGARFKLAPNPSSSASSPTYLLTLSEINPGGDCPIKEAISINAGDVDARTSYHEWTIGGAMIPFKYYKGGDHTVAGNTSVVGYLGFKLHRPGGDMIFGLGAGPSTIGVPAPAGSTSTGDVQATGFTYALMLLGQLGYESTTQFGLAIGHDRVSSNLNWVNNGKTWIGIQIGAKIF